MLHHTEHSSDGGGNHYSRLILMTGLAFLAMYVLMYSMVDAAGSVFNNLNQVYMAALMAAPMVVIELWLMASMYPNRKANALLIAGAVLVGIASFAAIRTQTAIGDRQFLRSMIPHHSGAILMCQQASLESPRIRQLCGEIVAGQQAEIDLMKQMLAAGEGR
jgi:hypothetical protein